MSIRSIIYYYCYILYRRENPEEICKMYKMRVDIIGCDLEGRFKTAVSQTILDRGSKAEIEAKWAELRKKILECPSKSFKGFKVQIVEI